MRQIIAAAGMVLAMLLGDVPTAAAQTPVVGVGAHRLEDSDLQALQGLGVRHVRTTIYWNLWDGDPAYRRRAVAEVRAAARRGLEPLVVVHGEPARFGYRNRAAGYRAYAAFIEELVRALPEVGAWQLWNEMDVAFTTLFGASDGVPMRQRGVLYGEMLKLAYPAVKRANPQALVVTGGVASEIRSGFIDGLYDSGAPFDVLAIHTYGFPVLTAFEARGPEAAALMRRRGRVVPLWNTEFGMEAAVVPRDWDRRRPALDGYHLAAWRDPILLNQRERLYARAYGHVLREGGDESYDLVRRNGQLRPAAVWLRDYLRQ
jgi:hypothetical protein